MLKWLLTTIRPLWRGAEQAAQHSAGACPRCGSAQYRVTDRRPDHLFNEQGRTQVTYACPACGFSEQRIET